MYGAEGMGIKPACTALLPRSAPPPNSGAVTTRVGEGAALSCQLGFAAWPELEAGGWSRAPLPHTPHPQGP